MRNVFADTAYFLALLNPKDAYRTEAIRFASTYSGKLITTAWVLAELGNSMSRGRDRSEFCRLIQALRANADTSIVEPSFQNFDAGLTLFEQRTDKEWSLTDCISMAVMDELGLREVLTTDHHFTQAGFIVLLKKQP